MFALLLGLCYGGAFYFSLKKIGVTMTGCYEEPEILKQINHQKYDLLNHCVMQDFNSIDKHFFPDGIKNFEMNFD